MIFYFLFFIFHFPFSIFHFSLKRESLNSNRKHQVPNKK